MTHIETELFKIRQSTLEMMQMVKSQLQKGRESFFTTNKDMAFEVMHNERRVNGYELLIDNECENLLALFSPVAIDLRFVLAVLKINYHLERIGDNAKSIAQNVIELEATWDENLINSLNIEKSFDIATDMLEDVIDSFETENTSRARKVFEKDKKIDEITTRSIVVIAEYLKNNSSHIEKDVYLLLIHRKLERIGDLVKNIAEEIIFYLEAKILKHKAKSE